MNKPLELETAVNRAVIEPPEQAQASLLTVIQRAATDKDVDMDKMERLLQMHERIVAKQAEQQFNEAMRLVQSESPRILRDATNPSTNSRYTRLESLLKIITPIYTEHGFSISFGTADCTIPQHYRITAVVSHKAGHSRPYQCDVPIDNKGMKGMPTKTETHGFGSTMSYGRRYLTLLIFNLALVNEDDDKSLPKKPVSSGKVATTNTRLWMIDELKKSNQVEAFESYASEMGWLAPDDQLGDLALEHVPTTRGELNTILGQVQAWVIKNA